MAAGRAGSTAAAGVAKPSPCLAEATAADGPSSAALEPRIVQALEAAKQEAERIVSGIGELTYDHSDPVFPEEDDQGPYLANLPQSQKFRQHHIDLWVSNKQQALDRLQEEIDMKKAKEREFARSMDSLIQSHEGRQSELQDRIVALTEEKKQLESICELQDREQEMVQVQLDEMCSHKQSCESRVQFLMDLLVSLLSNGSEGEGAAGLVNSVLQDGEERERINESRHERIHIQLEKVRKENRILAQRLSHIFSATTAVHDKLCARQNELFSKRTSTSKLSQSSSASAGLGTAATRSAPLADIADRTSSTDSALDALLGPEVKTHLAQAAALGQLENHVAPMLAKLEDVVDMHQPQLRQVQVLTSEDQQALSIAKLLSDAAELSNHAEHLKALDVDMPAKTNGVVHEEACPPLTEEEEASTESGVTSGETKASSAPAAKEAYNTWKSQTSLHAADEVNRRIKREPSAKSNGESTNAARSGTGTGINNLTALERKLRESLLEVSFDRPVVRIAGNPGIYRFGDDITALVTLTSPEGELMIQRCENPENVAPASPEVTDGSAPQPVAAFLQEIRVERNTGAVGGALSAPTAAQLPPSQRRPASPDSTARRSLPPSRSGSVPAPGGACSMQFLASNASAVAPSTHVTGGGSSSVPIASAGVQGNRTARPSTSAGGGLASTPPTVPAGRRRLPTGSESARCSATEPRSPGTGCPLPSARVPVTGMTGVDKLKDGSRLSPMALGNRGAPFRSSRASHPGEVSVSRAQQTPPPPLRVASAAGACAKSPASQAPAWLRNQSSSSLSSPCKGGCPVGPCLAAQVEISSRASAPPTTLRARSVEELVGRASSPQTTVDRSQRIQTRVLQSASSSTALPGSASSPVALRSRQSAEGAVCQSPPFRSLGSGSYCPAAGNLGSGTYPGGSGTYGSGTYNAGSIAGSSPQPSAYSTPRRQTMGARQSPMPGMQMINKVPGEARSFSPQSRSSGSLTAPTRLQAPCTTTTPTLGVASAASYGGSVAAPASAPSAAGPGVQRKSLEAKERGDVSNSPTRNLVPGVAAARPMARSVPRFSTPSAAAPAAAPSR
mmetsp:Transcript_46809/g.111359  ORF Transcript_46809/g.111359 Transcript_46809/m.111359 type:complete len:1077 (-) Transcript_46809:70-3300(-)|eukprot:CAMPEP_0178404488 /NCGR_PEP_ID=MMETSP0689_2-20121128/17911_1 /TAXON_ID=160604 /ORGANISM="Amphidinium massartii, Strain CS-259" /LENGTH=1076 /DNA_ID=CAMNT_0020025477 /DNA_START=67 /DNA_END=3294 /DNA_ORIENTATION=+